MAEQLVDRLINVVDNLREETRRQNANASGSQVSRANRQSSQSTESEMRRLYQSINSNVRTNLNVAPVVGSSVSAPDRNYVPNIRNFQPSTKYRPKNGKRNVGRKRTRFAGTSDEEDPSKEKSVLRDVVLITSPKTDCIPRGSEREKLYMQGCVISAFEIRDSHTENDIRKRIIDAFGEKLKDLPEPKFKFVRAVGNKIIDPSCQTYSGKVLKYLNKQGPIYVRAVSAISEQDLSDEENFYVDSDEDILMISAFEQKGISSNKSDDEMQVNQGASTSQNTEGEEGKHSTARQHRQFSDSDSPCPIEVNCPTCYRSYPPSESAKHADR